MTEKMTYEQIRKVDQFTHAEVNILSQLRERWQDEKEYEDFADYGARLKRSVEEYGQGFEFVAATKSPFGMKVKVEGFVIHVTVNSRSLGWKRLK